MRQPPPPDRVVALFLLGLVLFNYPLLAVIGEHAGDPPPLWVGLFVLWGAFIALIRITHRKPRE